MKRTQLYLDDDLWTTLYHRAKIENLSVSELVRRAAREKYMVDVEARRKAMMAIVGIRSDWPEELSTDEYIRKLRRDSRPERLKQANDPGRFRHSD